MDFNKTSPAVQDECPQSQMILAASSLLPRQYSLQNVPDSTTGQLQVAFAQMELSVR
jgi:hypothetical protein